MDSFDTGVLGRIDVQNLFCNSQFLGLWKTEKDSEKYYEEMSLKNVFAFFFLEQWYDVRKVFNNLKEYSLTKLGRFSIFMLRIEQT